MESDRNSHAPLGANDGMKKQTERHPDITVLQTAWNDIQSINNFLFFEREINERVVINERVECDGRISLER